MAGTPAVTYGAAYMSGGNGDALRSTAPPSIPEIISNIGPDGVEAAGALMDMRNSTPAAPTSRNDNDNSFSTFGSYASGSTASTSRNNFATPFNNLDSYTSGSYKTHAYGSNYKTPAKPLTTSTQPKRRPAPIFEGEDDLSRESSRDSLGAFQPVNTPVNPPKRTKTSKTPSSSISSAIKPNPKKSTKKTPQPGIFDPSRESDRVSLDRLALSQQAAKERKKRTALERMHRENYAKQEKEKAEREEREQRAHQAREEEEAARRAAEAENLYDGDSGAEGGEYEEEDEEEGEDDLMTDEHVQAYNGLQLIRND